MARFLRRGRGFAGFGAPIQEAQKCLFCKTMTTPPYKPQSEHQRSAHLVGQTLLPGSATGRGARLRASALLGVGFSNKKERPPPGALGPQTALRKFIEIRRLNKFCTLRERCPAFPKVQGFDRFRCVKDVLNLAPDDKWILFVNRRGPIPKCSSR